MEFDAGIARALAPTAAALAVKAGEVGLERVTEEPDFNAATCGALAATFPELAVAPHRSLPLVSWDPSPGGVDVVADKGGDIQFAAELKWCWSKRELGWTLWDIYKLIAVRNQYHARAAYAIVGAPDTYWADESLDCCALFADGRWDSRSLFGRYWRAWHDLLHGGSGRPLRVPAEISTTLVGEAPVSVIPAWTIRAVRVEGAAEAGDLFFHGGWPQRLVSADRTQPDPPPDRHERVAGCLLGGAVGDALGAPVEFMSLAEIQERFGPDGVRDFAAAYGREGAITDDTQMTLFTAEGLLRAHNRMIAKGICSIPDVVWWAYQRWLHTQGEQTPADGYGLDGWLIGIPDLHSRRAPGNTCLSALRGGTPGRVDEPVNDSKGCGGVMRVAPVGILTPNVAFDDGCAIAALTHGHPAGYLAAGYLASVISKLLDGQPLWNAAVATLDELIERIKALAGDERIKGRECRRAIEGALTLATADGANESVGALGQGWVAEEALAISLYCALTAETFEDGVLRAVNHNGDSDSTGAITGNLLGAHFGLNTLPDRWLSRLELREVIAQLADDLEHHLDGENYEHPEGQWPSIPDTEWARYPGY